MSMMKFDDSKIKEIRKRKEQGLPPPPTEGDVVEQSKNAKGGSELIYQRVKERVPEDLWNYFQIILSSASRDSLFSSVGGSGFSFPKNIRTACKILSNIFYFHCIIITNYLTNVKFFFQKSLPCSIPCNLYCNFPS